MKTVTKSLITLAALAGATAAFAGDQLRTQDRLMDGTCLALSADGSVIDCPLLADQDQLRDRDVVADRDLVRDRDQVKLQDGSCLDGDGVPDRDGTGTKAQTTVQSRAQTQAQDPSPARARRAAASDRSCGGFANVSLPRNRLNSCRAAPVAVARHVWVRPPWTQ